MQNLHHGPNADSLLVAPVLQIGSVSSRAARTVTTQTMSPHAGAARKSVTVHSHLGAHKVPFARSSIGRRGQADGVRAWRGAAFTLILQPIMSSIVGAAMRNG